MRLKVLIMLLIVTVELAAAYLITSRIIAEPDTQESENNYQPAICDFGELIVNAGGGNGRRFFITDVSIYYDPGIRNMEEAVESNRLLLTDTLTTVLMEQNISRLATTAGRESLRVSMERVFENVTQLEVERVLFRKYLIQ